MENELSYLINRTEAWLQKPITTDIAAAIELSNALLDDLKKAMQADEASKKSIGPLIGRIKGTQNALQSMETMNWVKVGNGTIAIGHRPSSKLGTDLRLQNTTHILTLLSEGEGSTQMQSLTKKNGMDWLWFPMRSAEPPSEERYQELVTLFSDMEEILNNKGNIYIHCSAGIHRTGMISYAFLRFIGKSEEEAHSLLKSLRTTTSEGVGEERIAWVNSVHEILNEKRRG